MAPVAGATAYVGERFIFSLDYPEAPPKEGDVIYASGRLAAVGESREPGEPARAGAYFLADYVDTYEAGITDIDSKSLEDAVSALAKKQ